MGTRQFLLAMLAASMAASRALADGAFPDEVSVMLPENDPDRILVGTNFGLVISPDAGATWRYVCEPFITGSVNDTITFYQAASDGTVLATSFGGFWRTGDGGCTWTRATGSVANEAAGDVFIDANDPKFVVGIATDFIGARMARIHKSVDGGRSFTGPSYETANRLTGVEIAQSDPSVIYATEMQDGATQAVHAFLLKSVDRGATWSPPQVLNVPAGTEASIATVDPRDANKVYLRLLNFDTNTDSIALTTDAGQTLPPPDSFTIPGPTTFSAFLVAADGTLFAGTTSSDLYAAPQGTTDFSKLLGPRARCLGQRQGSPAAPIYACGDGFLDGYNLGVSDDSARTFRAVMKFTQISGPLTCPAVSQGCAAQFADLQRTLGVAPPAGGSGGSPPGPSKSGCGTAPGGSAALVLVALAHLKLRRHGATTLRRGR
jgi:photosystem II stability/assembly factor-like uncharacterized protein